MIFPYDTLITRLFGIFMTNKFKLNFKKIPYENRSYSIEKNTVYLVSDNWDDYSYKTQFYIEVVDENGNQHPIGQVKIGFMNQSHGWTAHSIPADFECLPHSFFSLGQDVEYYKNLENLAEIYKIQIVEALRDIVNEPATLSLIENESVFRTSLLRSSNYLSIGDQYKRVLDGGLELTAYDFSYKVDQNIKEAGIALSFEVRPYSKPSTNIHVLIGRNGIGKTTLLNGMITALTKNEEAQRGFGNFFESTGKENKIIDDSYFSALVSVSFSAFDPFDPPMDNYEIGRNIRYSYVGLKKRLKNGGEKKSEHKDIEKFSAEFLESVNICFNSDSKRKRWVRAIRFLESDDNFAEMDLTRFATNYGQNKLQGSNNILFEKMSSGHAIVLLTITKLVETVDEKTLVLMDEPESHLHPPLLSAFTRAIADLLNNRNGVAIIATHSPVLLQEVPKECVWKIRRNGLIFTADRPQNETFAENVGFLTREVFQLEVIKSGFHELLLQSVAENKSYDAILKDYSGKIGFEGKALLRALIASRDGGLN